MRNQEELNRLTDERRSRYDRHLHKNLDAISIVLKAHLFAEELLLDILKLHCHDSKPIENIQIFFKLKLMLAQALFGSHLPYFTHPDKIWSVLDNLNQLRNTLAHQIDDPKLDPKLDTKFKAFINSASQLSNNKLQLTIINYKSLHDSVFIAELLKVMFYLLGFLGCIHGIVFLNPPARGTDYMPIVIPNETI